MHSESDASFGPLWWDVGGIWDVGWDVRGSCEDVVKRIKMK
jgi:hypothetical protein